MQIHDQFAIPQTAGQRATAQQSRETHSDRSMLHPDAAPKCCSLAQATIHPLKPKDTPVPELRLPLSGDATHAINPCSWFFRTVESQVGSISMNLGKLADPVLEERIVNEFGNSGTEIGQLGDALPVLLGHTRLGGFAPGEQRLAV